jgi:hypothetical protein
MVIQRKSMLIASVGFILGVVIGSGGYLLFLDEHTTSVKEHDIFPVIDYSREYTISGEFIGKLSLFILAGQSNMSGRGEMPSEPLKVNPKVFVFGNDYRWHYGVEPMDAAQGQVDKVSRDGKARYSLATAFANTLLEKDSTLIIGFIPCARGATSIEKWQRNLRDNSLYGSCLKRARAASTMGHIKGILFWQGEADALSPEAYPERKPSPFEWTEKFTRFVRNIRNDLGLPDLPVIYAQLSHHKNPGKYIYWKQVKDQQAQVMLPNTKMVVTPELELSDYVHFTKEGYDTFGKLFGEAYWDLEQNQN